ncbi:hypothetical protein [Noviherbaspirillum aridicola]|uniref:Transferrin-binding protein B C-lobe/N-lobe beta barrel domain-containing protein n=1 Tax=Noviherbaspirillum aridicola TaxID=2849687 RepID=A0ABQ4Q5Z2_9BURK|nr:hypothetical protein [Noviherbaspirillum aridicola]GIZ52220.1 hypothetical protein NCCP691_22340 [Noviherbaspirillum aridicola]
MDNRRRSPLDASRTLSLDALRPLCMALLAAGMLAACGGGGGGGDDNPTAGGGTPSGGTPSGGTPSGGTPSGGVASTMMSCPDGAGWQCSGGYLRQDNGVTLTNSGVQVYGRSTSDLQSRNPEPTGAFGLEPASGGLAELRVNRNAEQGVARAALLLSNLDLRWDGRNDRPLIIETFNPTYGRTVLGTGGALQEATLPDETDLNFFNYREANLGATATQANYANNRYFPRRNPSRCPDPQPAGGCATTETSGLSVISTGDWRTGGINPEQTRAVRVHGDGDVHAGNGPNDANGNPTYIVGGNGPGVPFPGSKGYRELGNSSLRYANLASWVTQDTVLIREWTTIGEEHNKVRRGMVAFGEVTDPAVVPASGSASYAGTVRGWYSADGTGDPTPFSGSATLTVNFANRQASIVVQDARADNTGAAVPLNFSGTASIGAAGSNMANYMTAPLTAGSLTGGIGGRFFGAVASGGSGAGPAEAAGTFMLNNATSKATAVGGFIARKQ